MNFSLRELPPNIQRIILLFLLVLIVGVSVGLVFLAQSGEWKISGIREHYQGSPAADLDAFDIPDKFAKTIPALLLTTHNHVITFAIIFAALALIFSMNSLIGGKLQLFLITEPFISILVTFGSIWGLRFIHDSFLYLLILSGTLMYASFYLMAAVSMIELIRFRNRQQN